MLISDLRVIGNNLLAVRKKLGMTQMEVAEAAGLADRTYADIERGSVNMRLETILRICQALHITPDEILTQPPSALSAQSLLSSISSRQATIAVNLSPVPSFQRFFKAFSA